MRSSKDEPLRAHFFRSRVARVLASSNKRAVVRVFESNCTKPESSVRPEKAWLRVPLKNYLWLTEPVTGHGLQGGAVARHLL